MEPSEVLEYLNCSLIQERRYIELEKILYSCEFMLHAYLDEEVNYLKYLKELETVTQGGGKGSSRAGYILNCNNHTEQNTIKSHIFPKMKQVIEMSGGFKLPGI